MGRWAKHISELGDDLWERLIALEDAVEDLTQQVECLLTQAEEQRRSLALVIETISALLERIARLESNDA